MKLPPLAAALLLSSLNLLVTVQSFTNNGAKAPLILSTRINHYTKYNAAAALPSLGMTIVSPFDNSNSSSGGGLDPTSEVVTTSSSPATSYSPLPSDDEPLDLTWENVDLVLEEMRPYLLQDGGNVAISEIDGPIVRLELQVSVDFTE